MLPSPFDTNCVSGSGVQDTSGSFAGSTDAQVAQAYRRLYHAVDARRRTHDEQFAIQLAAATQADAEPGALLRVEDVLARVVRPILDSGRRVLLVVLDGMSTAVATELAESVVRSGAWQTTLLFVSTLWGPSDRS